MLLGHGLGSVHADQNPWAARLKQIGRQEGQVPVGRVVFWGKFSRSHSLGIIVRPGLDFLRRWKLLSKMNLLGRTVWEIRAKAVLGVF
jgi:hypothetical protein